MTEELPEDPTFVFVEIGGERYGLPTEAVHEILQMLEPTSVPSWPDNMLGLIDVRGALIPLVDVGPALSHGLTAISKALFVVLLTANQRQWGVLVQRVDGVRAAKLLSERELGAFQGRDIPEVCSGLTRDDQGPILLLDPDRLLATARTDSPSPGT
jgi:purine-binding chemotaxis protein CheW